MFTKLKSSYLSPQKNLQTVNLKLKLDVKRLYQTSSDKYLGTKIDQYLNWQDHINKFAIKLNKTNAMLYKVGQLLIREL